MRTIVLAGLCTSTLLVSTASAESMATAVVRTVDPSGAVMCFTPHGEKTSLADCESAELTPTLVRDPSGAPMCQDAAGQSLSIDACEERLASGLEPYLLDRLPDENAVAVANQFVSAIENDSVTSFAALLHPRGIHHGHKKIRKRALTSVVRTLGVRSFVSMPEAERWNVRGGGSWFSVFRGEGDGKTTIAYFELYRAKWRLVQLARVSFAQTASR